MVQGHDRDEAFVLNSKLSHCEEASGGPFIHVVDDFYPDPIAIRDIALGVAYYQYSPPLPENVGPETAKSFAFKTGHWHATSLRVFRGQPIVNPVSGFRYNPPWLRGRLERIIGEKIVCSSWDSAGDGWNGAFHLIDAEWTNSSIHHHHRDGDITTRGWNGVVYLSPNPPPQSGTSIWNDRESGLCTAEFGHVYRDDEREFDRELTIENKFNRLVLFRENVLHRGEHGFGHGRDARLTQTLFFESYTPGPLDAPRQPIA